MGFEFHVNRVGYVCSADVVGKTAAYEITMYCGTFFYVPFFVWEIQLTILFLDLFQKTKIITVYDYYTNHKWYGDYQLSLHIIVLSAHVKSPCCALRKISAYFTRGHIIFLSPYFHWWFLHLTCFLTIIITIVQDLGREVSHNTTKCHQSEGWPKQKTSSGMVFKGTYGKKNTHNLSHRHTSLFRILWRFGFNPCLATVCITYQYHWTIYMKTDQNFIVCVDYVYKRCISLQLCQLNRELEQRCRHILWHKCDNWGVLCVTNATTGGFWQLDTWHVLIDEKTVLNDRWNSGEDKGTAGNNGGK